LRLRLFALIRELVLWESTTNEEKLNRDREQIRRSWRRCCGECPPILRAG
jgi:putative DNA methylase